nr:unnamed protein product [Callosobruchus analis]
MPLTAAENQRRYRERRKMDPEREADSKRKDLERYHANKRLVRDLTPREHRIIKKKWRSANTKRKDQAKALREVMHTSESSPDITKIIAKRGRKQVKRNRSKLYRDNLRLSKQLEDLNKKYQKYKNRYHRAKQKRSKEEERY